MEDRERWPGNPRESGFGQHRQRALPCEATEFISVPPTGQRAENIKCIYTQIRTPMLAESDERTNGYKAGRANQRGISHPLPSAPLAAHVAAGVHQ